MLGVGLRGGGLGVPLVQPLCPGPHGGHREGGLTHLLGLCAGRVPFFAQRGVAEDVVSL